MNNSAENTHSKKSTPSHFLKCALGAAAVLLTFYLITLVGFNKVLWAASQVVVTPLTLMSYSWTVSLYLAGFFVLTFSCMFFAGQVKPRAYKYLFIPFIFCLFTLIGYGGTILTQNAYTITSKKIFSKDNQDIFELTAQLSPKENYVLSLYGNFNGKPNDIFSPADERYAAMLSDYVTEESRQKAVLVNQKHPHKLGDILGAMLYLNYAQEKALYPQCVRLVQQYNENTIINSYMVMKVNGVMVDGANDNACKFGNINNVVFSWDEFVFHSEKKARSTQTQPSIIISNTLPPLPPTSPPPIN